MMFGFVSRIGSQRTDAAPSRGDVVSSVYRPHGPAGQMRPVAKVDVHVVAEEWYRSSPRAYTCGAWV